MFCQSYFYFSLLFCFILEYKCDQICEICLIVGGLNYVFAMNVLLWVCTIEFSKEQQQPHNLPTSLKQTTIKRSIAVQALGTLSAHCVSTVFIWLLVSSLDVLLDYHLRSVLCSQQMMQGRNRFLCMAGLPSRTFWGWFLQKLRKAKVVREWLFHVITLKQSSLI